MVLIRLVLCQPQQYVSRSRADHFRPKATAAAEKDQIALVFGALRHGGWGDAYSAEADHRSQMVHRDLQERRAVRFDFEGAVIDVYVGPLRGDVQGVEQFVGHGVFLGWWRVSIYFIPDT